MRTISRDKVSIVGQLPADEVESLLEQPTGRYMEQIIYNGPLIAHWALHSINNDLSL